MTTSTDALNWRYATKVYDTNKKLNDAQLQTILESLRMAPSSYGLQPYQFIVVNDPAVRAQLRAVAWDQSQVTDASHFIVCAVPRVIDEASIDAYIDRVASVRGTPRQDLAGFEGMMDGAVARMSPEERVEWATRQVYLALGFMLTVAAIEGIDATPMEGFDTQKFDEILGLEAQGFASRVAVAVGFRSDSDAYVHEKKVRAESSKIIRVVA